MIKGFTILSPACLFTRRPFLSGYSLGTHGFSIPVHRKWPSGQGLNDNNLTVLDSCLGKGPGFLKFFDAPTNPAILYPDTFSNKVTLSAGIQLKFSKRNSEIEGVCSHSKLIQL